MNIITHRTDKYNLAEVLDEVKERIISNKDKSVVEEQLKIFDQLCEFEYGRWLLANRGLNAFWSYYMGYYEEYYNSEPKLHPLERIMIEKSPGVVAAKENKKIFSEKLQSMLRDNMTLASIPCGLMNDLLRLDYSKVKNVRLVGIDLDQEAVEHAKVNAKKFQKEKLCSFIIADAWELGMENEFDFVSSQGLNMYVPTTEALINLYKSFYKTIKPNGYLIIGSNTPPCDENGSPFWDMSKIDMEQMQLQKLIYNDVIQVRQGVYPTESEIIGQLKSAGFRDVQVFLDELRMFPVFVALK